ENGVGLPTSRVEGSIIYFARTRFAPGETKTFTLTTDVTLCHFPPGNHGNFHTLVVEPDAAEAHQSQHGDLLYLRCPEEIEAGAGEGKKGK
ncbi:MAG: hypothetical protein HY744_22530, partial [Deltaproteobacteria bacterium]|nr:hypothetical protein [Deltaproteobacteria bacterium]